MSTEENLAMFPATINGKNHAELREEIEAYNAANGVHRVDGVNYTWIMPPSNFEALKSFQVRDDDVYVITFPKSGTHWIGEIIAYVVHEGRDDFDRTNMTNVLETTLEVDPSKVESTTPGYKIFEKAQSPRIMGTHCRVHLLPPQIWEKKAKVIYLARNPKDRMVSHYNFIKPMLSPTLQNWDAFLFYCASGEVVSGSWSKHVLSYWKHRDDDNVLFLKYEDLHKDLEGGIRKVADHLGKSLSDDVIRSIIERVTFAGMQKTYKNLEDKLGEEGKKMTQFFGMAPYLLKGKVGTWKEFFTAEQSALFDKIYATEMEGSGLDFDFEL